MPNKNEKARRKEILRAQREHLAKKVIEGLPVSVTTLKALFDHLDSRLSTSECDNTLHHAREFIANESLPEELIVTWLTENSGYCDCEALANAEQVVEDAVPGYRDLV